MFRIQVENIKCAGCANSIERALLRISGVDTVSVNVENGTVLLTGDADRAEILEKLARLGYPEMGHNSITCKAKSYVSCALGRMGSNEN